jgi:hypothetical protein
MFGSRDEEGWDMCLIQRSRGRNIPFSNIHSICRMSLSLKNGGTKSSHFAQHTN